MKIYIAVCEDRHTDADVKVFTAPEKAIEYAKQFVLENASYPEDVEEWKTEGWLYHVTYSNEGDSVYVEEGELDLA
jgi:hypothetical protein